MIISGIFRCKKVCKFVIRVCHYFWHTQPRSRGPHFSSKVVALANFWLERLRSATHIRLKNRSLLFLKRRKILVLCIWSWLDLADAWLRDLEDLKPAKIARFEQRESQPLRFLRKKWHSQMMLERADQYRPFTSGSRLQSPPVTATPRCSEVIHSCSAT